MKRLLGIAVAVAAILTLNGAAEARSHHKKIHYQHQISDHLPVSTAQACEYDNNGRTICGMVKVTSLTPFASEKPQKRNKRSAPTMDANGSPATGLIMSARSYLGRTASEIGLHRHTQWCAAFLRHLGVSGPVDDRAISFAKLPHIGPQVGAIAVYPHHVGIISGFENGYPIIISGNSNGRRVYEGVYPRRPLYYVSAG